MATSGVHRGLALVIDHHASSQRETRALLESRGYEAVCASTGMAGLELIQRLPATFRLVLIALDLRGIPGTVVLQTLRLFRPDLPVLCIGHPTTAPASCLRRPVQATDLDASLAAIHAGTNGYAPAPPDSPVSEAVSHARARFANGFDLVEAALELARGTRD
jgi:CheY-like chemotaxis protein